MFAPRQFGTGGGGVGGGGVIGISGIGLSGGVFVVSGPLGMAGRMTSYKWDRTCSHAAATRAKGCQKKCSKRTDVIVAINQANCVAGTKLVPY